MKRSVGSTRTDMSEAIVLQVMVRDLYKERDMGHYTGMMTELVEAHGVLALKLTPTKYALPSSCMLMHVTCIEFVWKPLTVRCSKIAVLCLGVPWQI